MIAPAAAPLSPSPPNRQLIRLQGEFHMCGIAALNRLLPAHYTRGILLMAIIRACLSDWVGGDLPAPPAVAHNSVSILSIAQSLHCPFETARRHVHALIADAYCATDGRRVFLSPDGPHVVGLCRYLEETHDNLLLLAESLAALDLFPTRASASRRRSTREIVAASIDLALVPFEHQREPFLSWTAMAIWGAIAAAAVRDLTTDPVMSRRYADVAAPDPLRRAVSIRQVAQSLGIPQATAWRHGRELAELGLIIRHGRGWTMAGQTLADDRIVDGIAANVAYLIRKLREADLAGEDAAAIAGRYLVGRPSYMPFD